MEEKVVDLRLDCTGVLYYSLVQAGVPLVASLVVTNLSDTELADLKIEISFDYDFVEKIEIPLQNLDSQAFCELQPKLNFHSRKIFELNEKIVDKITVRLLSAEQLLAEEHQEIAVLPVNQWSGPSVLPETLASFVMPNLPEISLITARAAEILKAKTGDPSFTGYLSNNKNRVLEQMAAIYAAIYELKIVYSILPASYGEVGQRIRTPQEVYQLKQANCIEMSLLYASACESVGLNPFIVGIEGHAFVGVWLKEQLFDSSLVVDSAELRKRLAAGINDIEVLEATFMNQAADKNFDQAVRRAHGHLENQEQFHFAVDIARAHLLGLRPFPVTFVENGQTKIVDYGFAKDAEQKAAIKQDLQDYFLDTTQKESVTKSTIWMRNLLDLSKRNSLISFRPNARNIQLFTSDIASLEDALSNGDSFHLVEVTGNLRVGSKTNRMLDIENEQEFVADISRVDFKAKKIRTFMEADEMGIVLKNIYRDNQKSIEENGASSLFLAMGFLRWIDSKDGTDKDGNAIYRYAPLILVPVDLKRKSINKYQLRLRDEDSQMNITLLEFLRQQFNLSITGLNPLPKDESGIDVRLVFNSIRKAIMEQKGWDILETACLGHFSFSQFVMWNDLKLRFDQLTENKVVKGLVEGLYSNDKKEKVDERTLDEEVGVSDVLIPSDVDSSQLSAIIEATQGKSFVLHGPPGTGKSQTITNMIANAMYQGKSVLFVAEKMAALNVVYQRLSAIGLEDFCLELHSNKTSKRVVLDKFEQSMQLTQKDEAPAFKRKSQQIQELRTRLNQELKELHFTRSSGRSVYELISSLEEGSQPSETIVIPDEELARITPEVWDELLQKIRFILRQAEVLEIPFSQHPLAAFKLRHYDSNLEDSLKTSLQDLSQAISYLEQLKNQLKAESMNLDQLRILRAFSVTVTERNLKTELTMQTWERLLDRDCRERLQRLSNDIAVCQKLQAELDKRYTKELKQVTIRVLRQNVATAKSSFFFKKSKIQQALSPLNVLTKNGFSVTDSNAELELAIISDYLDKTALIAEEIDQLEEFLQIRLSGFDKEDAVLDLEAIVELVWNLKQDYPLDHADVYKFFVFAAQLTEGEQAELNKQYQTLLQASQLLLTQTGYSMEDAFRHQSLEKVSEQLSLWMNHLNHLKNYASLSQSIQEVANAGFATLSEGIADFLRQHNAADLEAVYLCSLTKQLIHYYVRQEPHLARFNQVRTEEDIRHYNTLIAEVEELSRNQVRSVLTERIPNEMTATKEQNRQLANLNKIIRSKGRGASIRQIFQENGDLIKTLTPCLLMSPLSVAQYIDLDFPKFDLVIFDEASQIRTGVAVGAMSRAENCIIVGDPNQMPPTAFFNSQKLDEDNLQLEDLESLLEDCLAINLPQKHLSCHYRSASESLIAFSNSMYYGNRMLTFPSPSDSQSRVSLVNIDGIYERGQTRTNPAEAQAIVQEIIRRLKNAELANPALGLLPSMPCSRN